MKRLGRLLAFLLLTAPLAAAQTGRFDAPLGGPPAAPPVPTAPAPTPTTPFGLGPITLERPRLDAGCDLSGDWRVQGQDDAAGELTGTIRFAPLAGGGLTYARQVSSRDLRVAPRLERGRARVVGGRLYLMEESGGLGLDALVNGPGVEGPSAHLRRAVYRLDLDGRRLEGLYRQGSTQGRERLSRGGPDAADNRVTLLVDGGDAFPAFREALASATDRIHFQTFIFRDDATGKSVGELLKARARAGVKVRVLVDAVGDHMGRDFEEGLREAGVELVTHHSILSGLGNSLLDVGRSIWGGIKKLFGGSTPPREKRGVLNHDHRKIIVVDGRVGFCGGMNVGKEYESEWHDVHARVEGSAVAELERLFLDRWRSAGGKAETPQVAPPNMSSAPPGDMSVDVVAALPGISQAIKARYLREVDQAKTRVLVENAYFLEDDIIAGMRRSAGRGVRNLLIIPADRTHDVGAVRDAFAFVQNDIIRAGIELYKYDGRMTHAKVAAFDGRVATVGSSNLDSMALTKLAECNLFVNDHRFARTLEERVFVTDLPRSTRQVVRPLSWWEKVKGGTLHFGRSFL